MLTRKQSLGAGTVLPDDSRGGAAVRLQGAVKDYDGLRAMGPLDLDIEPGEFVAVIGPSGCGKSTLLMAISGLIGLSQGTAAIDGEPVTGPSSSLGLIFQQPNLLEWRTVEENILLPQEIRHLPRSWATARVTELLDQVGLTGFSERYPSELSGGMAQRVALCRALLCSPQILLADEPFGALDALTRERMNSLLNRIWRHQQCTVLMVTHGIDEAVFLAQKVVVVTDRPARVAGIVEVDLPVDRTDSVRSLPAFAELTSRVRELLAGQGEHQ